VVFTVDGRDSDPAVLWSGIIGALAAALPAGAWTVPARMLRQEETPALTPRPGRRPGPVLPPGASA
jgi:hypothetical protein